jgi:hypothetical protein
MSNIFFSVSAYISLEKILSFCKNEIQMKALTFEMLVANYEKVNWFLFNHFDLRL